MIIRTLITLVLAVPAFWLTLRYNMHMFQLNTYKAGEQAAWIKKNFHLQWILVWAMCLGIVRMLLPVSASFSSFSASKAEGGASPDLYIFGIVLDVLIWITLAVIIAVYRLMVEMNSKKPLKFTPRVKRMIGTIVFVSILFAAFVFAKTYYSGGHYSVPADEGAEVVLYAYDAYSLVLMAVSRLGGVFVFLVGAQLFLNMISNLINSPVEQNINNGYIRDAKRILAENPDLTIIGVTGSYGKTSIKFYLETLLQAKYSVLVTPESYNTPMGVVITIRKWLRPSHQIFICEMGARYVGEIKELCDLVHPNHGIIASIGPQHLDTFGSLANIQATKFELADALPEGGMLFLNGDNEYITEHLDYLKKSGAALPPACAEPVMYHAGTAGTSGSALASKVRDSSLDSSVGDSALNFSGGYYASDIKLTAQGTTFTAHSPDGELCTYDMKLVGGHNIINVMGAIAVAHEMGIALDELRIPVRRLKSVPHRMEMKTQGAVTIIDDAFNSNPIGSKAAVETLAMFDGIRILITPGMVELGEDEAEIGRAHV